jgi:uncharacterized protein YukE
VSEELAKTIEKEGVGRLDGTLRHLAEVIEEGGGVTIKNVEFWTGKTRMLFDAVNRGTMDTAQAAEQLNKIFPQLAATIVDSNGLASKSMIELIRLNDQFGLKTKAVVDFVDAQMKSSISGLKSFLDNATISSQGTATAMGSAVAAVFEKMRRDGKSTGDALKELNPVIEGLQKQFDKTGFSGGEAFNKIRQLSALASDEIVSKAMTSVKGLDDLMKGLHNSGLLDQQMFSGLSSQISTTWKGLIDQGKNGTDVMRLMQPQIQTVWELQQKFGFSVDDTTQKLLNEAQASGIAGSSHRSNSEMMLDMTGRLTNAIEFMAQKMGYQVPQAVGTAQGAFDQWGERGTWNANRVRDAMHGVPSAVGGVEHAVRHSEGAFDHWAREATERIRWVRDDMDRLEFGSSPGGIKDLAPMMREAAGAFGFFGSKATEDIRRVRREVDAFARPGGFDISATGTFAVRPGRATAGEVHFHLEKPVIAGVEGLRSFMATVKGSLADDGFRHERAELNR